MLEDLEDIANNRIQVSHDKLGTNSKLLAADEMEVKDVYNGMGLMSPEGVRNA